jgi:glycosyltransferase involved in cell wall biosynthesis
MDLATELSIDKYIYSSERVQYVRMPQIYNSADVVLVFPSMESTSAIVLEALACEIPVVSVKSESNFALLPAGWCVNPNDSVEIAGIVKAILGGNEPVSVGRARVHMDFEQEDVMNTLLSNYRLEIKR